MAASEARVFDKTSGAYFMCETGRVAKLGSIWPALH
jgi:hypothetical protein